MRRNRMGVVMLAGFLALLIVAPASYAQADVELEGALRALRGYEQNESRAALTVIRDRVQMYGRDRDVMGDTGPAAYLNRSLLGVLTMGAATPDAKAFVCRQMVLLGNDESVPVLASLLADEELAAMARYALVAMGTEAAREAVLGHRVARLMKRALGNDEEAAAVAKDELLTIRDARANAAIFAAGTAAENQRSITLAAELLGARRAVEFKNALVHHASESVNSTVRVACYLAVCDMVAAGDIQERVEFLERALDAAVRPEQYELALPRLADIPTIDTLNLAGAHVGNDETGLIAADAMLSIALAIADESPGEARAAAELAATRFPADADRMARAGAVIARIERNEGFITEWVYAGPFTREGAGGSALFDVAFAPEPGTGDDDVQWKAVPAKAISHPGIVDFNRLLGGGNRAVYLRTEIESDRDQPVRLEIGSDDGVKVWLNGEVVHANNASRGLRINQDVATGSLIRGKNVIIMKITQGGGGWQGCCRLRDANGFALEGVRVKTP